MRCLYELGWDEFTHPNLHMRLIIRDLRFWGNYDRSDLADFKQFQNRIFRFFVHFPGQGREAIWAKKRNILEYEQVIR